jgi:ABC-2 type transport system permease protein
VLSSKKPNYLGCWTLYKKEVIRFLKVYNQTLIAPVVTALLFLAVFHLAMGNHVEQIAGVDFSLFMASGLIIMTVVQNAFANTSSVLVMGKVIGNGIDYIMPPFSPGELVFALLMAALTRGIMVGIIVYIAMIFFIDLKVIHPFYAISHIILASLMLGLLGILTGIMSNSFDQMQAVTSYIITPLSFLSGTFYSVNSLPKVLHDISHLNPFFYMIDGFRYGLTNYHDGDLSVGFIMLISSIILLWIAIYISFKTGWRIKT